ncbi:MAG TPA: hypothetical protein VLA13_04715 [Massilibacterium sp.]|nr:hypothetical protein [Massilibacterium sp.]
MIKDARYYKDITLQNTDIEHILTIIKEYSSAGKFSMEYVGLKNDERVVLENLGFKLQHVACFESPSYDLISWHDS